MNHPNNEVGGYRYYLSEKLKAAGSGDVNFVGSLQNGHYTMDRDHEGHIGITVDQMTSQVSSWLYANPPDVILLLIGTNDLVSGVGPAVVLNRMAQLLDTIHAVTPGTRVVVANQPGVTPSNYYGLNPQNVNTFNAGLPAVIN